MARSRQRSRRRKRRGTQGGAVKQAPRARGAKRGTTARMTPEQRRIERQNRPPSWRRAFLLGAMTAGFLLLAFMAFLKRDTAASVQFALLSLVLYVPAFYFVESFTYQRRQRLKQREREQDKDGNS